MVMGTAGAAGGTDGRSGGLVSQMPDLTGVSLGQAQSLGSSGLGYAVQQVLRAADADTAYMSDYQGAFGTPISG